MGDNNCEACNHTQGRKQTQWAKCLNQSHVCLEPVLHIVDNVNSTNAHHESQQFRNAQIVKKNGVTVYGRWRNAKYDKKTGKYILL
jgi:hypothetical protein